MSYIPLHKKQRKRSKFRYVRTMLVVIHVVITLVWCPGALNSLQLIDIFHKPAFHVLGVDAPMPHIVR